MVGRPVVEVRNVSKRFCRSTQRAMVYGLMDMAAEFIPSQRRAPILRQDEFWALKDVSFSIAQGEAVAIAGRNGAGKTTLMRILAGLLKPDCGEVTVSAQVNPVIELGQGLNSQLSGRENAELGLAWRGVAREHLAELVPQIGEFSELGDMFDAPIHTYSSGMRVRLSFAIAACVPSPILLLDEVLAVGDIIFQRKCLQHMQAHLEKGGSLILVSHNIFQMQAICRRGILIENGKVCFDGAIETCIDRMIDLQQALTHDLPEASVRAGGFPSIKALSLVDAGENTATAFGANLMLAMTVTLPHDQAVLLNVSIWTRDLSVCIVNSIEGAPSICEAGEWTRICTFPDLRLFPGHYALRGVIVEPETLQGLANKGYADRPVEFTVTGEVSRKTVLMRENQQLLVLDSQWSVPQVQQAGA